MRAVVALCMMVFMLSLAGIPPLVGFFGKFYVFTVAVGTDPQNLGSLWLVILAVTMSAVSVYYYLQELRQVYLSDPPTGASTMPTPLFSQVLLALLALAVAALGCAPNLLIAKLLAAIRLAGL